MVLYFNILQEGLLIHWPYDKIVFIYQFIYLSTYLYINLFTYLFISLFIHHFFSSLRINQCYYLLIHILFAQFIFYWSIGFVYFKLLGLLLLSYQANEHILNRSICQNYNNFSLTVSVIHSPENGLLSSRRYKKFKVKTFKGFGQSPKMDRVKFWNL